jgi:hypothetical protein
MSMSQFTVLEKMSVGSVYRVLVWSVWRFGQGLFDEFWDTLVFCRYLPSCFVSVALCVGRRIQISIDTRVRVGWNS